MNDDKLENSGKWSHPMFWLVENMQDWHIRKILESFLELASLSGTEMLENFFETDMINTGYFTFKE